MSSKHIQLYLTAEQECSYLPGRMSSNIVPDPDLPMDLSIYSHFIKLGYRRSGDYIYRPHCNSCEECRPCRIPVENFSPRRNQLRCLKRNQDLRLNMVKAGFTDEYFQLYSNYLNARHTEGGMANPQPDDFDHFLYSEWSNSYFLEVRKDERLLAVAVTDVTPSGLSAVYTYFDPAESKRSLGTFCILQQIQQAKEMQLEHLYMGYWIKDCQKMKYKTDFQPMEALIRDIWQPIKP
ncbi:MAG: arginyltransferase [Gammaproteobacteria bacterium]|nr:arginyltransferase [Gammaproteobacteria bacterium]MCK5263541.1 arginyltransferase [Gammaproteobacteria bacterium]